MKYRIAGSDEHPTQMTYSQFCGITDVFMRCARESVPRIEVLKEYGNVVYALLNGKTIVFAEEEAPF